MTAQREVISVSPPWIPPGRSELPFDLPEDNLERDGSLVIFRSGKEDAFHLAAAGSVFPGNRCRVVKLPLDSWELFRHVEDCRRTWHETVVDLKELVANKGGGQRWAYPFQDAWDLSSRPELLRTAGARLAVAGAQLYHHVFQCGNEQLDLIDESLQNASRVKALTLTITSDSFFAPWGMLYVHPEEKEELRPDGANFVPEGFWGFRHIVEHDPEEVNLQCRIKPNGAGLLSLSINIDDRIDGKLKVACIEPQLMFFRSQARIAPVERRAKPELRAAMTEPAFGDQVVYFCCHGIGSGTPDRPNLSNARVSLSDGEPITAEEIAFWLKRRDLESNPLVFVNACQGGQMTTLFYQTLAAELLKRKAVGLIGAQVDVPAIFATEYCQRFFQAFLNGEGGSRVRVGPLMRELGQEFFQKYANPLGLVYALYRGADCFLDH